MLESLSLEGCSAPAGREAFFEGHLHAFATLGGIPTGQIRYDNLRAAVSQVLFGRTRTETARWRAFRTHHGFSDLASVTNKTF